MRLGLRWISSISTVNSWAYASAPPQFWEGDSVTLWFQLVDEDSALPGGLARRYIPASGSTFKVTLDSVEDARRIDRFPTQPYPTQDASIWRLDLAAADGLRGSVDLRLSLNEGGLVHSAVVKRGLAVLGTSRT